MGPGICLLVGALAALPFVHAKTHAESASPAHQTSSAPPADLATAQRAFDEARAQEKAGKYDAALELADRARAIRERLLGPDDLAVADALHLVAVILDHKNEYKAAEPINRRALAIREQTLGPDHPDVAKSLFNLAWLAYTRQDFDGAEALYARTLRIQEQTLQPEHQDLATTLNDLAVLYGRIGRYDAAIATHQRVLELRERAGNREGVALTLNNLARVHLTKGEYETAADLFRRSATTWEDVLGADHPRVANAIDGLAQTAALTGDFTAAEPLYQRVVAIREKTLGPDHPEVGTALNNLAVLYRDVGDLDRAVPLLQRDLAITEARLGPTHSFVAPTLSNLAIIHQQRGEYERAEALFRRALDIQERALGPAHLAVGITLSRLGRLLVEQPSRDAADAEALLQRAHTTIEKAAGSNHPEVALVLTGLASLRERLGDFAGGEALLRRALAMQEEVLGGTHPNVAQSLEQLATLRQQAADAPAAIDFLARAYDIRERDLVRNLPLGSERQKIGYLRLFANDTDQALALARLAPQSAAAVRLALTTTLRRKGRALDATSDAIGILRARAGDADQAHFDRLAQARSRLAAWSRRGPAGVAPSVYRARLQRLEADVDQLEADLNLRSAAFRSQSRSITVDAVRASLPADGALIEFVLYRPVDDRAGAALPRYAAFALTRDAEPTLIDLGTSREIDRAIAAWRRTLRDPRRADARRLARAVDAAVMAPVRAALSNPQHLLISPDGQLNLIPFAALVDEQNRYLVERHTLTYLTSGRDLLRLQAPVEPRGTSVVIALPDFGTPALLPPGRSGREPASAPARVDESRIFFGPLPGVADEVRALRTLLPDASFLTRAQATEAAIKALHGPRILHVATHGFFLDDTANPLLRSGLALTGANQGRSGSDDGVLTALEAAGLDLWGTRLVVLSACDTGVGEVKHGDGVYGLRRALVIAGAETQLMSLWPVSDLSTRDLMTGYYARLIKGAGRGNALRETQLQLLRDGRHAHPYHWASFIQSGAWTSLEPAR